MKLAFKQNWLWFRTHLRIHSLPFLFPQFFFRLFSFLVVSSMIFQIRYLNRFVEISNLLKFSFLFLKFSLFFLCCKLCLHLVVKIIPCFHIVVPHPFLRFLVTLLLFIFNSLSLLNQLQLDFFFLYLTLVSFLFLKNLFLPFQHFFFSSLMF